MSKIQAFRPETETGFDALTAMLTSGDAYTQCLGRAFASGMGGAVEQFLRAEQQRGTSGDVLIDVIADIGLQHLAAVAAYALKPSGDQAVVDLAVQLAQAKLASYIETVRATRGGAA